MSDANYFRAQAERCRRLAVGLDERTMKELLAMAREYEAKADQLDSRPRWGQ